MFYSFFSSKSLSARHTGIATSRNRSVLTKNVQSRQKGTPLDRHFGGSMYQSKIISIAVSQIKQYILIEKTKIYIMFQIISICSFRMMANIYLHDPLEILPMPNRLPKFLVETLILQFLRSNITHRRAIFKNAFQKLF